MTFLTREREAEELSDPPREIEIEIERAPAEIVTLTLDVDVAKDLLLALTRALGRAAYNNQ